MIELLQLSFFDSISVRILAALAAGFVAVVICGRPTIRLLLRRKIGEDTSKSDSELLNELHQSKQNTPTMGGVLVVGAVLLASLLFARLHLYVGVLLGATLLAGAVGAADDWEKLTVKRSKGMSARKKMALLCLIGLLVGGSLLGYYVWGQDTVAHGSAAGAERWMPGTSLFPPFLKSLSIPLGPLGFVLFALFVVVGTSNSVNLTDGLDGLAPGLAILVALTFAAIAYLVGRADFATFLLVPYVPAAGEVAVVLGALAGSLLGFMWFNAHPAQIFLGDTGSLAIGALLATSALICKQELLLPLAGGLFVVETLSVMLQVGSFKLTGKRVFRIAPIHHHFQFGGLPESKVTFRFWVVGLFLAWAALLCLKF